MKAQVYGLIGMGIGLIAICTAITLKSGSSFVMLLSGVFVFGCGLIAAAIGAKK